MFSFLKRHRSAQTPVPPISARLQPAIKALLSDDEATGERLLREAVDAEPADVNGWLWMATLADSDENHTKSCLERALFFNPDHKVAGHLLEVLQSEQSDAVFPELTLQELVDVLHEGVQFVGALRMSLGHLERLLSLKPDLYTKRHGVSFLFKEVDAVLPIAYRSLFQSKELASRSCLVDLGGLRQAALAMKRVAALIIRLELCLVLPKNQTTVTLDEIKHLVSIAYEPTNDCWATYLALLGDSYTKLKLTLADKQPSGS